MESTTTDKKRILTMPLEVLKDMKAEHEEVNYALESKGIKKQNTDNTMVDMIKESIECRKVVRALKDQPAKITILGQEFVIKKA